MGVTLKTVMPGVTVRTNSSTGSRTVRFACMINGVRHTKMCDLPIEILIDQRTKRPTAELRAEYNLWVDECSKEDGRAIGSSRYSSKIPTVGELAATYKRIATARSQDPNYRKPSERAIQTALQNMHHCIEVAGMDEQTPANELLRTETIRMIFNKLCERISGISAWSYISSLQSITANWTLEKYKSLGYRVEPPVMPDVGNAKRAPEYKMLSQEQKDKIEAWYTALAAEDDKQLYLAASIVAQLAVRPSDVVTLKAENFVRYPDDEYVHLVYRPHKTIESSNRRVDWPIRPALWDLICTVAGDRLKEGKTLIKGTRTVFDKLNKSMRKACGMETWNKAVYELRKLCVDTVRREQGVDAAVALSGDRRETIDRYYSDPYKLTGITPIEIMAMPAI